ncbi:MAG: CDGSH iron-sulfur domain-containing protein [Actinomycetota bacterium]
MEGHSKLCSSVSKPTGESTRQALERSTQRRSGAQIVAYGQGPYLVRGSFDLVTIEGEPITRRPVIALCGCGRSKAVPLCDGSHKLARAPKRP